MGGSAHLKGAVHVKVGGQVFEGGRATLGPPLQHRPERGQDIGKTHTRRGTPRRYGLRKIALLD